MKKSTTLNYLLLSLTFAIGLIACNADVGSQKKEQKSKSTASYYLPVPAGWTSERIPFPIDFAPGIKYTGTEDLRFAKGWGDPNSSEHWCYAFVWWLDGQPLINATSLQQNLNEYYDGLISRNTTERNIPKEKVFPTEVSIQKTATENGDKETFTGTIKMLNYLATVPQVLNCKIHIKECNTNDHTAVFFQLSPQAYDHEVWRDLSQLNNTFSCGN